MKFSIIIPVYNVEDYVTECLNSIVGLNLDYEIIIVNDGSTDNSLEKIESFASLYEDDLILINKKNGGLSSARNAAIDKASGDYLFFLDSDDYIDKKLFESFAKEVVNDGVDIGFANYKYLKKGKTEDNKESEYRKKLEINGIVDGITYGELYFDRKNNYINTEACFALVKRKFIIDNSIKFKIGIYHEDTLFIISCLMKATSVKYYDYPFYIYRMRDGSTMHSTNLKSINKRYNDKGVVVTTQLSTSDDKMSSIPPESRSARGLGFTIYKSADTEQND